MFGKKKKRRPPPDRYKIKPAFQNLSNEVYEFILENSEKRLVELIEANEHLTEKSHKILGVLITLFLVTTGYATNVLSKDYNELLVLLSSISSIGLIPSILKAYFLLFPTTIAARGGEPFRFLEFEGFLKTKDSYQGYLLNEIQVCQKKIWDNSYLYNGRKKQFKSIFHWIIGTIIADLTIVILYLSISFT